MQGVSDCFKYFYYKGGSYAGVKHCKSMQNGGGIRGEVTQFSRQSRKRLLVTFNKIDKTRVVYRPLFITLTYPDSYPSLFCTWKRHLDNFLHIYLESHPDTVYVWRLEFQERGAPHFHIIAINTSYNNPLVCNKESKKELSRTWYEVVDSGDIKHLRAGTNIKRLVNDRQLFYYVSKYTAKVSSQSIQNDSASATGRFWGIRNKSKLPVTEETFEIDSDSFFKIRRILNNYLRSRLGSKFDYRKFDNGLTSFISESDANRIFILIT